MGKLEQPYLDDDGKFQTVLNFRTQLEEDRFISREKERWAFGWGNLTGRHYFHLTQGNMLDNQGEYIHPIWRDGDALVFDAFDEASLLAWDLAVFKRKEFGFSTIFLGCMPIYNCIMYENSTSILTSCDVSRTNLCRLQKLYPYLKTTKKYLMNEDESFIDNHGIIQFRKKIGNDKVGATIAFPETSDTPQSPTKIAAFRAIYGCVDEMLLHPRASSVQTIMNATLNTGLERTALKNYRGIYDGHHSMYVMGGSCDSMDKSASIRAQEIIQEAPTTKTKIVFIPATMCNPEYMVNGFSQKEKAEKKILENRKRLLDGEAFEKHNIYVRSYPLNLPELFDATNKAAFGATVPFKLKESRLAIMNANPEDLTRCDLRRNGTSFEMAHNPEGVYYIRKMPVKSHVYIGGVDSIPFNTQNMDEKLSKFCCVIKDITTNEYVAYFMMRDPDPEVVLPLWEKICVLYSSESKFPSGAPCMVERNRFEVGLSWCKRNHKNHLLLRDPNNKKEFGYFKGKGNDEVLMDGLVSYIRLNGLNFIQAIDDFEKSSIGKSDILDAHAACEYGHNEWFNKPLSQKQIHPPIRIKKRNSSGKTYYEYVEEQDSDDDEM